MNTIKEQEKELFNDWEDWATAHDQEFYSNGGLLFRGEMGLNEPTEDGRYTWYRLPGDEEERWCKAGRRLMLLTKDLNDDVAWDIREETGGRFQLWSSEIPGEDEVEYNGKYGFYRRLNQWVYGIMMARDGKFPSYEEVTDLKKMGHFYESAPLVRINCKYEIGGGSVDNTVLEESMNANAQFLERQFRIYHPNIVMCCGRSGNILLNFVREHWLNDLEEVPDTDNYVYYSKTEDIIVLNSYHPSCRYGDEELYEELMYNFVTVADKEWKVLEDRKM